MISALQLVGVLIAAAPAAGGLASEGAPHELPSVSLGVMEGRVQVRGGRQGVVSAIVRIEGWEAVAETDLEGRFLLALPPGHHRVTVWAQGFVERVFDEEIAAGARTDVVYRLDPDGPTRYETRVSGEREFGQRARNRLQNAELREVAGTQGEPLRVVSLMPGVAGMASGLSYPVVRGASPAATGYFIDGVRVPQLFHLMVGPSVVHPDFLESVGFHPGLAPLKYGRLLGGAVEANVATPRDGQMRASAYLDLVNAGAYLETPLGSGGPRVTLAGRFSLLPFVGAKVVENVTRPSTGEPGNASTASFWDYQARIEQRLGAGRLRLLALGSSDALGSAAGDTSGFSGAVDTSFHRADLRFTAPIGIGVFEVGTTWGTESMGAEADEGQAELLRFGMSRKTWGARSSWSADVGSGIWIRAGADVERQAAEMTIGGILLARGGLSPENAFHTPALATMTGAFVEATWRLHALEFLSGLRLDNYHLVPGMDLQALEPRLGLRWALSDTVGVRASAGVVHQPPTILLPLPISDTAGLRHGLQEGAQVSVGGQVSVAGVIDLSADVYFTNLSRAVEYGLEYMVENRRRQSSTDDAGVPGRAYGLEFMVRRPQVGPWFGWISYSLQRSERLKSFYRFDAVGRASELAEAWVPFAFDQTHVVNATLGFDLGRGVKLGTTAHWNSGRPEGGELTSRAQRPSGGSGGTIWVPAELDEERRLPPYFRLDLRASKEWIFDEFRLMAYVDVMNVALRPETFGYTYDSSPQLGISQLTRTPIAFPIVIPMIGLRGAY